MYLYLQAAITKAKTVSDGSVWLVKVVYLYLQAAVTTGRNSIRLKCMDGEGIVSAAACCSNKSRNSVRQKCMDGEDGVSVSAGCSNNRQKRCQKCNDGDGCICICRLQ